MCDHYTITKELSELPKLVKFLYTITDIKTGQNVAPHQSVPVLVRGHGEIRHTLKNMVGGLIPAQSKREKDGNKLINIADGYLVVHAFPTSTANNRTKVFELLPTPSNVSLRWTGTMEWLMCRGRCKLNSNQLNRQTHMC